MNAWTYTYTCVHMCIYAYAHEPKHVYMKNVYVHMNAWMYECIECMNVLNEWMNEWMNEWECMSIYCCGPLNVACTTANMHVFVELRACIDGNVYV